MDYTFKMLRNNTPVDDYATAIMLLDAYPYHLIGQPISVRYWKDESHIDTEVVLAIGIKNYNDKKDNDSPSNGPDFYRIIGAGGGSVQWEEYSNGNLEKIELPFRVAQMTPDEFNEWVENFIPNAVSFVSNEDKDVRKIYKGDKCYGTTDLLDMKLGEAIYVDGVEFTGDINNIIETLQKSKGTKWKIL